MQLSSKLMERAVDQLATLPGVGRRTAMRLALDLLRREKEDVRRFVTAIGELREQVNYCEVCCNIADSVRCRICSDPRRDGTLICVVEDIRDVMAIESTKQFSGLYHVLGGIISPIDGIGPDDLNTKELFARVEDGSAKEAILALSTTLEGDTTSFYLFRKLQERNIAVSLIARGISVGGELEHVDEITLGRSIVDRKPYDEAMRRK